MVIRSLLLVLLCGAALLLVQRIRLGIAGRRGPGLKGERTLFSLVPGDIVQARTRDWVVEDRLLYDEEGFQWLEYLLRDGADSRWLVVCEDDALEVSWLETVDFIPPTPLPRRLQWQGETYVRQEEGQARVTASHRTMNRRPGSCHYFDYRGPGRQLLCVERWGAAHGLADRDAGETEVCVGEMIEPLSLSLLPGDGQLVYR